jgi:hypothetical protein
LHMYKVIPRPLLWLLALEQVVFAALGLTLSLLGPHVWQILLGNVIIAVFCLGPVVILKRLGYN